MKYKYEYYKMDKLTGKVLQYEENSTKQETLKNVFNFVLSKNFFRDEWAEGKYYYQVCVTDHRDFDRVKTKTYINREEINHGN